MRKVASWTCGAVMLGALGIALTTPRTGAAAPAERPASAAAAESKPTSSPPALPDTPPGRRAAALAAALRDGSEPAMRQFFTDNYAQSALAERPAADRVVTMKRVLRDLGHGTLVAATPVGDREIEVVFKAEGRDLWLHFTLQLEPQAPFGVHAMRVRAEDQPPAVVEPASQLPLSEAAALEAIGTETDRRAKAGEFSGVVLVARNGEPVLRRAVGLAERSFSAPVTAETRFNLGSINKIFTKVVMQQLAEEGKLDLAAPLQRALPDYPNRAVAEKITLQQLLDHTSGLGDIFGQRYEDTPKSRLRSLQDYLPLFVDRPLEFPPGSQERYSNAGYVVLGLVIEHATGKSYYDAVRERVFARAGMTASESFAIDNLAPQVAMGYTRSTPGDGPPSPDAPLRSNLYTLPARGSSAGGGYSTVDDLLRFARALREGRLVKRNSWQASGGLAIAGGSPGVNAALEDDWGRGSTVVVLSNLDPPSAQSLATAARRLLARVPAR
jgi:D-alanyl-D-alanine carboxypeptidase